MSDDVDGDARTHASPRHVPDAIIAAPGIPHTRTGKKLEVPVKNLLLGKDLSGVLDLGSVDVPELLDWYAAYSDGVGASHEIRGLAPK